MKKYIIFDLNGLSIIEFIEYLIDKNEDKKTILHNLSYHFGGSRVYIEDWDIKERKRVIVKMYNEKYKDMQLSEKEKHRRILQDLRKMQSNGELFDTILTTRVIRHAIEAA